MKYIGLIFILFFFCSCATIRFVKSSDNEEAYKKHQFHHIGLLGLYEYSSPVSPEKVCGSDNVSYIETEHSLVTWAIRYIPSYLGQTLWLMPDPSVAAFGLILSSVGLIYTPMSVNVACQNLPQ